ncbi:MAG TPA: hypothetical protein VHO27_16055 [Angustibacter sp.]|nr:hypothetical protein [Angustibacter sp.]
MGDGSAWRTTTHEWAAAVDAAHLAHIRDHPDEYAPGGLLHLVLEAIAYPADEALHTGGGHCVVTLHADGSVSVADDGRGTDTRYDEHGTPIKKPVMATRDVRFFDAPDAPALADGHPRRGMSVVAALSSWLRHTNHRGNGSWTQRYERGVPVTGLDPIAPAAATGTTVHFLPDAALVRPVALDVQALGGLRLPHLRLDVRAPDARH